MSASQPPDRDIQTFKMSMTSHKGASLCLLYPSFLKVKSVEPYWTAMGPKSTCPVYVLVDPDEVIAKAHSSIVYDNNFNKFSALNVVVARRGNVKIARNGLIGYEQLIKTTNPIGEESWIWIIDGYIGTHKVIIHIDVPSAQWGDGKVWNEFVNSIQMAC